MHGFLALIIILQNPGWQSPGGLAPLSWTRFNTHSCLSDGSGSVPLPGLLSPSKHPDGSSSPTGPRPSSAKLLSHLPGTSTHSAQNGYFFIHIEVPIYWGQSKAFKSNQTLTEHLLFQEHCLRHGIYPQEVHIPAGTHFLDVPSSLESWNRGEAHNKCWLNKWTSQLLEQPSLPLCQFKRLTPF